MWELEAEGWAPLYSTNMDRWNGRESNDRGHREDLSIVPSGKHACSLITETKTTLKIDVLDPILMVLDEPISIIRPTEEKEVDGGI